MSYIFIGDEKEKNTKCIQYGSIVFFSLVVLSTASCYRFCLYVPLFVILLGISETNYELNAFLLMIIGIGRFIYMFVFGNMQYCFLSRGIVRVFGEQALSVGFDDTCIVDRLSKSMDTLFYMLRPTIIAAAICFLYFSCYKKNKKDEKEFRFPISLEVSLLVNSFAGVILVIYTVVPLLKL